MKKNCAESKSLQTKNKNIFFTKMVALFLEVHIVLINMLWAIIEQIYRSVVPIPEKSVKGEKVLITGAGHGLGRELALLYAAEGATVICWDVNEQNNEETLKMINKLGSNKAYAYTCDVTNYNEVTELCAKVEKEVGDVTILVNNAGIMPSKPFLKQSIAEIQQTMNVNIMAHFWILKAILPTMVKNNYGHIVAVSSLCGIEGMVNLAPYCASKFAVRGLMAALQKELAEDDKCQIKTTTAYPYIIDTGLVRSVTIRFPFLTPVLKKEEVAKYIISAQRRNVIETAIPGYFYNFFLMVKSLPYKAEKFLVDFVHIKVDADE